MSTEAQRRAVQRHHEKLDTITLRPAIGTKARWREAAEQRGVSLTALILEAVEKEIGKT